MSIDLQHVQLVPVIVYVLTLFVWGVIEILIRQDVSVPWLRFAAVLTAGVFMIEFVFFNKILSDKNMPTATVIASLLTTYVFVRWYQTVQVRQTKIWALVVTGCLAAAVGIWYVVT